jgi:hypothetical protein
MDSIKIADITGRTDCITPPIIYNKTHMPTADINSTASTIGIRAKTVFLMYFKILT